MTIQLENVFNRLRFIAKEPSGKFMMSSFLGQEHALLVLQEIETAKMRANNLQRCLDKAERLAEVGENPFLHKGKWWRWNDMSGDDGFESYQELLDHEWRAEEVE